MMNGRLGHLAAGLMIALAALPAAASTGTFQGLVTEVTDEGFTCAVVYSASADEGSTYRFLWKNVSTRNPTFYVEGKEVPRETAKEAARVGRRVEIILGRGKPTKLDVYAEPHLPAETLAKTDDAVVVLELESAVSVARFVGRGMQAEIKRGEAERPRQWRTLEVRSDPKTREAVAWTPPPGVANHALSVTVSDLVVSQVALSAAVRVTNYPLYEDEPKAPTSYAFAVKGTVADGRIEGTWTAGEGRTGAVRGRLIARPTVASPAVLWLHAEKGFSDVKGPKRNTVTFPVADEKASAEGAEMIHYKGIWDGTVDAVDLVVESRIFKGSFTYTQADATFTVTLDGVLVGTYAQADFVTRDASGQEVMRGTCLGRLWPEHPVKKQFGWPSRI